MEPRLPRFAALRDKWDPERRLRSAQSVRLFGDHAGAAREGGRPRRHQRHRTRGRAALAERGDALFLLGRDETELARSAADLQGAPSRAPQPSATALCDLEPPEGFAAALDAADAALGGGVQGRASTPSS